MALKITRRSTKPRQAMSNDNLALKGLNKVVTLFSFLYQRCLPLGNTFIFKPR